MSSIYRRARPATFAQVLGQDHVKTVLTAAIAREAVGHAYLFSGPRGVGKTTTARLLAMALNCDRPGDEVPCGTCESCAMIRSGAHPDVTELDAASNNSVEDIRELRDQVRLASLRGGTRVWILDEAHMLSRSAANALLKTLEEPPPRLVFILATTEPEKLLPTVLSRCQHFRFRRLTETEIAGKLATLCEGAGIPADEDALALVARAADGAMRDAESMLERLLASGDRITRPVAEDALGLPPQDRMDRLAGALAAGDVAVVLETAGALYRDGFAPRSLAEQLARTLRDALWRSVTGASGFTTDLARDDLLRVLHALDDEQDRFVRHDDLFALEAAILKAHNALFCNVPADATTVPRAAADGARVSRAPVGGTRSAADARGPGASGAPARGFGAGDAGSGAAANASPSADDASADELPAFDPHGRTRPAPAPAAAARARAAADPTKDATPAPPERDDDGVPSRPSAAIASKPGEPPFSWQLVKARASAQLKAFLMPAQEAVDEERAILRYGDTHRFHFQELKKREDELAALVAEVGGAGYTIVVEGPGETLRKKP